MPTLGQIAKKADLLTPWANGGGGMGFNASDDDPDSANAKLKARVLEQALQFDPNAKFSDATGQLEFDASGLPKFGDGEAVKPFALASLDENNAGDRLLDPSRVLHDDTYGDWTSRANLKEAGNDQAGGGIMGAAQMYMPTVISAIMSTASGGLMSPQLVQAMAAASEGDMDQLKKIAPGLAMSIVGGQVGGALLPSEMTSGLNMIKPYLSLGQGLYGARKGNVGSGVGAGLTLAKLLQGAGNA